MVRILTGLILGAITGLVFSPGIEVISPVVDIFVNLLKMIVMPVVISTLIVGAGSIHPAQLGRVGVKALGIYMITTAFAVAVGLFFGNIFQPGKGIELVEKGGEAVAETAMKTPSLVETIVNIVPLNPFGAISSGKILPSIFSACFSASPLPT